MTKYAVMVGNPVNGFHVVGPFDSIEEANDWGDREDHSEWWTTPLQNPREEQ